MSCGGPGSRCDRASTYGVGEGAVAFVVRDPVHPVSDTELDAFCLEYIARFKRPRAYRFLEQSPKNDYGKVLKTELRAVLASCI